MTGVIVTLVNHVTVTTVSRVTVAMVMGVSNHGYKCHCSHGNLLAVTMVTQMTVTIF